MLKNYHTHTFRCNHAAPDERAYIENAIAGGLQVLGFADHVPMPPFPDQTYVSYFRMGREQLPDYIETLTALKKEYEKDITILIGFEAEYYPEMFEDMLELLQPYPYDYLILGQHCVGREWQDACWPTNPTDDPRVLKRYVDYVTEGMQTGVFGYLCHPDLINFTGDEAVYLQEMKRICDTALLMDMPLECNLLGLRGGRNYPCEKFFRLVAACGCKVILGCDAHEPASLNNPQNQQQAYDFLAKCGVVNVVEDFRLR